MIVRNPVPAWCLAALAALWLSACNYPVAEPTATLELQEIEDMVGATLAAEAQLAQEATPTQTEAAADEQSALEGEGAATPTRTPSTTPTPSVTPSRTPVPTSTSAPTSTPPPTATPRPTNPPPPSATPPPPSDTPPPPTACAKFTNPLLSAKPGAGNQVGVNWSSSGGCEPITGKISATYERQSRPYAVHEIKGNSGNLVDKPEPICEGTYTIVYELVLQDASGLTLTTKTEARVTWVC